MIIIDVDNCIADDAHRWQLIDWRQPDVDLRYHAYHTAAGSDPPANHQLFDGVEEAIAITAMPEVYRAIRIAWLKEHFPQVRTVIMRPHGCHMRSRELKLLQAQSAINTGLIDPRTVTAAYDDKWDVCAMYMANFCWPAFRVAINEREVQR